MSDEKKTGELEKKITVSNEDCDNVRNYGLHFGIEITPELEKAMKAFEKDPSYEGMLEFKLEVCKWLTQCQHESFKDKLWEHPKTAADDALYDLQFDRDIKEVLGAPAESPAPVETVVPTEENKNENKDN